MVTRLGLEPRVPTLKVWCLTIWPAGVDLKVKHKLFFKFHLTSYFTFWGRNFIFSALTRVSSGYCAPPSISLQDYISLDLTITGT